MKKLFSILTSACALGVGLMSLSPAAIARDRVDWSVSIGSGGYTPPVIYAPPPVVYGPPPVIYAPPRVVHAPPVVYQRVVPVVQYGTHPSHWREHRRHKHHERKYHRHQRHHHQRHHHYGY